MFPTNAKRFGLRLLLAYASLSAIQSPSGFALDLPSPSPDSGNLTIYDVRDSSLKPSLSECLKKRGLGTCLKKEMPSSPENPGSPGINPNWVDFLGAVIGLKPSDLQKGEYLDAVGANFAIDRLDPDEVLGDPNKVATDQKLGGQGVWVRHFLEVVPPFGYERGNSDDLYAGGVFTLHGSLHIVRRHPMDQIYNTGMTGYTRSEIKVLEQLAPTYLKIPYRLEGSGFLPGEGMEIERFGAIEIATGSAMTMIADPTSWFLQLGIYGSAGPTMTFARGHFRTLMEVQKDNTIRVVLEKLSENNEKLEAQIDVGVEFSIVTFVESLIDLETSITQAHKTIFDMNFDTHYEPAMHALKMAYLGRFAEALQLAAKADSNFQGVRLLQTSQIKENSSKSSLQIFTFNKSSELLHDQVSTQNVADGDQIVESTVETSKAFRNSSRSNRELEISFENTTGNSIHLKYKLKSSQAKPDEIREFSDLARLLGPSSNQPEASSYAVPDQGKNKLDGFFYLALDAQAFSSALGSFTNTNSIWMNAWAKSLSFPMGDHFSELSLADQETTASSVLGGADHLRHFRNFVKALQKTLAAPNVDKESKTFVKSFRGEGTDLYPLAALASVSDRSHALVLEQVNITAQGAKKANTPDFMQFQEIGPQYVIPPKY
jgi:hypothetical protein